MKEKRFTELVEKLSKLIPHSDGFMPSVSPTNVASEDAFTANPDVTYIYKNMDLDKLSNNQLYLTHTLLHRFYPNGAKNLAKEDIEALHKTIKKKIKHTIFDQLDKHG